MVVSGNCQRVSRNRTLWLEVVVNPVDVAVIVRPGDLVEERIVGDVVDLIENDDDGPLTPVEGAPRSRLVPDRVPSASLVILIVAALATVALGFAGHALFEWFDPYLTEVFA